MPYFWYNYISLGDVNMNFIVLVLSLLMGLSFLVGLLLKKNIKSKKMTYFATGLAFMIIIAVLFTDIIPEIRELSTNYFQICLTICGELAGIFILALMDIFVPHHHHEHSHNDESKKEHKDHLYHIGLLTFISVILHNALEGVAFFLVGKESIKAALLMAGGIALHNIPLGIEMSCFFEKSTSKNRIKYLLLVLSGTFGSMVGLLIGDLNNITNLVILSITCGMMLYIGFMELGVESFNTRKEKGLIEGLLVGAIIFALMLI